ncbi:MAG: hypothetical protein JWQ54_3890 [Mucilaginibacter sp.]|nr:hypothetical protein [Mucilaginibacter sp.]
MFGTDSERNKIIALSYCGAHGVITNMQDEAMFM